MEKQKPKNKWPRVVRWIGWVFLVQFILVNISAALYAYRFTHVYNPLVAVPQQSGSNILTKTWRLFSGPRQFRQPVVSVPPFSCDTITLKTSNGSHIDAWYTKPDSLSKGTVILFHGIMGNKGMLVAEASAFHSYGYTILLVDFRAHGNSGGHVTTIGTRESEEVKLAYDYMVQRGEKNIFLYGVSMGAVTVTKAIADFDLHPSGVFLDMPFASLTSHIRARARGLGFTHGAEKPFGFLVTCWIGIERGYNGFKCNTSRYVKKLHCPVLMQWGAEDTYVLKSETDAIYKEIASPEKKLVIYDQAGHESLLQSDPVKWEREIKEFLAAINSSH